MKFTNRGIRALKPKAERYEVWEDNGRGFGVRISPKGRKSWVWLYRFQGRARRMTFGDLADVSLTRARSLRADAKELLRKGIDPGTALVEQRREAREALTVKELSERNCPRSTSSAGPGHASAPGAMTSAF